MRSRQRTKVAISVFILSFFLSAQSLANSVGEVLVLKGKATRQTSQGVRVELNRGDKIFEADRIQTAGRSFAMLKFNDKTRFNLGPNTEFRVDEVRGGDSGVFSGEVIQGAFRFITGLIAKQRPRAMRIKTGAVATIGIRGTTVAGEVDGDAATIVLLESEDPDTPSAIEVGNEHGQVEITQAGYGTRIPDAHSPPTPPERMTLRSVENLIRNINNIQRISVPRPMIR